MPMIKITQRKLGTIICPIPTRHPNFDLDTSIISKIRQVLIWKLHALTLCPTQIRRVRRFLYNIPIMLFRRMICRNIHVGHGVNAIGIGVFDKIWFQPKNSNTKSEFEWIHNQRIKWKSFSVNHLYIIDTNIMVCEITVWVIFLSLYLVTCYFCARLSIITQPRYVILLSTDYT